VRIERVLGNSYYVRGENSKGYTLNIDFVGAEPMPGAGDTLYLSENVVEGIRENLFSYTFSAEAGSVYARPPHDFLQDPKEFLILEYGNGKIVILEQWYG